jgi:integrase/recombinase XerD
LIGQVPTLRVKRPRVDEDQRLGIDLGQARRLLAVAAESGSRDESLMCLLLLNGLRASEVSGLTVGDVDQTRGHRVLTVLRKGAKLRRAALAPRTARALDAHLAERGTQRDDAPLLSTFDGGQLSRHGVARATQRLAHRAGLGRLNPHELRHAFITLGLDAGVTLRDLQEAAGHSDPKTTIAYDRGRHALDRHPTYALAQYLG